MDAETIAAHKAHSAYVAGIPPRPGFAWIEGAPPHPWNQEWFFAQMRNGQCIALKAREGDHDYNYTTADETYWAGDSIARWMRIPDTEFVPFCPAPTPPEERREGELGELGWIPVPDALGAHRQWRPRGWLSPDPPIYTERDFAMGTPILPENHRVGDWYLDTAWKQWKAPGPMANAASFAWLRPHAPTEPTDLPLPYQAEAIARGEMAERLRVAEGRVAEMRAGIEQVATELENGRIWVLSFAVDKIRGLLGAKP